VSFGRAFSPGLPRLTDPPLMVYNDLMQNPFIVPVKILRGDGVVNSLGIYSSFSF
jgi:hypothetical protein